MLSERVLKKFVAAVEVAPNVDAREARHAEDATLPEDFSRLIAATARWRSVRDLWFVSADGWRDDKAHWDRLATAFELEGGRNWPHAFWSRDWLPIAHNNSYLQFAYAPRECFGGPPGQVIGFDFKGGEQWVVFTSLDAWLDAVVTTLEVTPPRDLAPGSIEWALKRGDAVHFDLPTDDAARRSSARFSLGESEWIELLHQDGSRWAIRARRASYQVRLGDPEDPLVRERSSADPSVEVARLIEEQKAEGFTVVSNRS